MSDDEQVDLGFIYKMLDTRWFFLQLHCDKYLMAVVGNLTFCFPVFDFSENFIVEAENSNFRFKIYFKSVLEIL